jgi:MFS family permease
VSEQLGIVVICLHNGIGLADLIGRKMLIGGAYLLVVAGITIEVVANGTSSPNAVFFIGKLINGFAIGGIISSIMTYVGEVSIIVIQLLWRRV